MVNKHFYLVRVPGVVPGLVRVPDTFILENANNFLDREMTL